MDTQVLSRVLSDADALDLNGEGVSELRRRYPELRFTVCRDDDLDDRAPFETRSGYTVHLLSSDGHCLSMTNNLDAAVGLVLALIDPD